MKFLHFFFIGMLMMIASPTVAQNELTASEKEAIQDRIRDKVDEYQAHLKYIADKGLTLYQRKQEILAAKVLFIGECESYSITNEYGENQKKLPVRIELSSVNRSYINKVYVKNYLNNTLNNVHRYGKVELTAADMVRVDQITKTPSGSYEAMAYYVQKYIAYNERGQVVYSDITTKKIKVYVDALYVPGGVIWDAKLGDIYVTSTQPLGD